MPLRLAGLLTVEALLLAAAAAVLWRLGSRPPFRQSLTVHALDAASPAAPSPADTLAVAAYWCAAGGVLWLLVGSVLHTAAAAFRRPILLGLTAHATLPAVRRMVAASLVAATVASPTAAWSNDRGRAPVATSITVRDGRSHATATTTTEPTPPAPDDGLVQDTPQLAIAGAPPATGGAGVEGAGRDDAGGIVIREGESLWELTARVVAAESGRARAEVPDDEIAPRWVQVCDANRDRLRSGDLNVVEVGEEVVVPPSLVDPPSINPR